MSRFMMRGMVTLALLAMTSSLAMAQPGGPGWRRGGGFGFGGPGVALLAIAEVQKELGLSEADAKKLNDELRDAAGTGRGGSRENFRNLSEDERQKRFEEMRKQGEEIAKKTDEKLKATLTEAQYKRLGELRIQREGTGGLSRADIADKLKLTTEQKEKIAKLQEEGRAQFGRRGEGDQGARPSPEEMRARRDKLNADVVAVLTPEQKRAWDNLKGAKFEFPAPNFGGGDRGSRRTRPAAE